MHKYVVPPSIRERVVRLQGKPHAADTIEAARTALVVIDMQNHYVAEGFPNEAPVARAIVPNINHMAAALRAAGGRVVWIQTTSVGALEKWASHHAYKLTPEAAARRLKSLSEDSEGFRLFAGLEPKPDDLYVRKIMYSAMIPGSSELPEVLAAAGIDMILIAGTKTNVCCETTGRDASMLGLRVVLLSDGTATVTDEEHAGALNNFQVSFGDVMTVDEAVERLGPAEPAARRAARS
jgi:ureidoacrylate peracid hydrolase